jgi:eukaryotic-like serine/threonine-protein kinase
MALTSGTKLGPYEIVSQLGAGGMGEVYRARDSRLERTVAIKVLPETLANDADRLQRFEQEARALGTLSHPNLLAIYDVGTQAGLHYLVSEFLEGRTLRDLLGAGPLPQRKASEYALQIANGLAAAHDKGIVHRDLKPENVFVTQDEQVKILDFGLAKQSQSIPGLTGETATLTGPPPTAPGTVMGTVGYMSPEQVRGQPLDSRSDIFSFGAILYEMLAGRRAFIGESGIETLNSILKDDPPEIDPAQIKVSPGLDRIVRHCLEKNPANRFQSARDLAFALGALSGSGTSPTAAVQPPPKRRSRLWLGCAGAAIVAVVLPLLLLLVFVFRPHKPHSPGRLEFAIPVQSEVSHLALSPDGSMLAFVSPDDASGADMLTVQRIGSSTSSVLQGSEDASYPFWSPDDSYVGFFADGKLKKIAPSGGTPQILALAPNARGGSWGINGVIIYSPDAGGPLWKVNADGSGAAPLTDKLFDSKVISSHRWPLFLPDGDHFLLFAGNFTNAPDDRISGIYLGSLAAREMKLLVLAHSNPGYASGNLYYRDERGALVSRPLDIDAGKLIGEPQVIGEGVGFQPSTYWAAFTVAENETLVYNTSGGAALSVLTWCDRAGKVLGRIGEPGVFANPAISPDGNFVAVDVTDVKANNVDIWIYGLKNGSTSRFTFDPAEEVAGAWSRDGSQIAFRSAGKAQSVYLKKTGGFVPPKAIQNFYGGDDLIPNSWSRDHKQILATFQLGGGGSKLMLIPVSAGKMTPFIASAASQTSGQISPDGKWAAYASNESGDWEIYATTFPDAQGKWQVSRGGGTQPRWRGDGKEIFYIGPQGMLMAVPVHTEGTFSTGTPAPLFQIHGRSQISSTDLYTYDVAKDGKKFLVNRYAKPDHITPLTIVLNSAAEPSK